jgi:uncharacterized protein
MDTAQALVINAPLQEAMQEQEEKDKRPKKWEHKVRLRYIGVTILALKALLIGYLFFYVFPQVNFTSADFDTTFLWFILAGFVAQMIDGALGMAYGVSCSTLLLYLGVPPKVASAAVHTAEVFTTGVSGLSHIRFRNIDILLFFRIVFLGVLGAVTGAYLVSEILDGGVIKPYVAAYLLILGFVIIYKGIRNQQKTKQEVKRAGVLALFGGLFDSIGGGGWGPIVTSNLINQGRDPRKTIGTVNTAEFFVTFSSTSVFMYLIGVDSWKVVLGLVIGGVIAAPIGAYFAAKVNKRAMMIIIGAVIVITSCITIFKAFG